MLNPDLFSLQVAVAMLDPDYMFCILPWFEFGEVVYKKKAICNDFALLIEEFLSIL